LIDDEDNIKQVYNLQRKIQECKDMTRRIIAKPETLLPFLSIGRLVYVKKGDEEWGWGLSINFNKKRVNVKSKKVSQNEEDLYIVDVLLYI
jgi:ATP-dependent RNA helicase DOB1